ncbi:hypothetical protein ACFQZE_04170 [Paenibacillus sp. GCM10027627]|uniref:hypothetical protein n=1 Tax=unclassified Paenibacillus TaxID=185978 RepID=UPI00362BFAA1
MWISHQIKPFNEFWMNCALNQAYSIATSLEPSYKYGAYLNNYYYHHWFGGDEFQYFYHTMQTDFFDERKGTVVENFPLCSIIKELKPFYFKDPDHCKEEIVSMLREGKRFSLNVDLYYWIPGSVAYKSYHWNHYSLFTGYNEETDEFRVLEDDLNGYEEHTVPLARFEKAFFSSNSMIDSEKKQPHGYEYIFHSTIPPYRLEMDDVQRNAARLAKELRALVIFPEWNITIGKSELQYYTTYSLIGIHIIINRHHANERLVESLRLFDYISDREQAELLEQIRAVKAGWSGIRDLFYTAPRKGQFDQAESCAAIYSLWNLEADFWAAIASLRQIQIEAS